MQMAEQAGETLYILGNEYKLFFGFMVSLH